MFGGDKYVQQHGHGDGFIGACLYHEIIYIEYVQLFMNQLYINNTLKTVRPFHYQEGGGRREISNLAVMELHKKRKKKCLHWNQQTTYPPKGRNCFSEDRFLQITFLSG